MSFVLAVAEVVAVLVVVVWPWWIGVTCIIGDLSEAGLPKKSTDRVNRVEPPEPWPRPRPPDESDE